MLRRSDISKPDGFKSIRKMDAQYMMYQLYEIGQAAFEPVRLTARFYRNTLHHPLNPVFGSPICKSMAAGLEVFDDITRKHGKPRWGLRCFDRRVNDAEPTVEIRLPFCNLISFKKRGRHEIGHPKVLLVAPLSGHFATLLRDTVTELRKDFDVFVTDWKDGRDVSVQQGSFGFSDYVRYVQTFMQWLGAKHHVIAVCQPGPAVLAATALVETEGKDWKPNSVVLMGSPIDTRRSPTQINDFSKRHSLEWFESNCIMTVPFPYTGFMRRVYPGFLQLFGFMNMDFDRHLTAYKNLYKQLANGEDDSVELCRAFYGEYLAVMDLPAEYYLETLQIVFQEHHLAENRLMVSGSKVDLSSIRSCALMTIEGEKDDISGIGQTQAAHELCHNIPASCRSDYIQKGVGHYGVFSGSRWRKEIAPRVREFIRSNSS